MYSYYVFLRMDSKVKELLSNSLLFTIGQLGSKILVFLMVPFYTYVLTPEEYGISGVVQTTATLLAPLLILKIHDAVLRFCFRKDVSKQNVFSIGVIVVTVGGVVSIAMTWLLRLIPMLHDLGYYMYYIPFILFSNSICILFSFFARGIDKVKESTISGLIVTFVIVCSNIIFLLFLKIGVAGYLLSFIIADIVASIYLYKACRLKEYFKKELDLSLAKEMVLFSIPLIPNSIGWWLMGSFNNYFILSDLGTTAVGLYTAALRIPSILTALSDIFSQAWLLSALKNYESEEGKLFIKAVHRKFFSILCVLTSLFILFSYPIAKLLLSGEFSECWKIIPLLFVSVFLGALVSFYGAIFSAENKTSIHFTTTLIGGIISVAIVLAFLKSYGLMVVSIATVTGYLIIWFLRKEYVKKYIDIGMTTVEAIIYISLLIGIAILVAFELYLYAGFVCLGLFILNGKQLMRVAGYLIPEAARWLGAKIKKGQ